MSERPGVTPVIPGGDPRNPMGVAVLGLDRGNYAIHGTNNCLDRRLRLARLHPHVQRRHPRPVRGVPAGAEVYVLR